MFWENPGNSNVRESPTLVSRQGGWVERSGSGEAWAGISHNETEKKMHALDLTPSSSWQKLLQRRSHKRPLLLLSLAASSKAFSSSRFTNMGRDFAIYKSSSHISKPLRSDSPENFCLSTILKIPLGHVLTYFNVIIHSGGIKTV